MVNPPEYNDLSFLTTLTETPGLGTLSGVAEGLDGLILGQMARHLASSNKSESPPLLHIVRDDQRLSVLISALRFFAPDVEILAFPAWDCVPYDRVSPNPEIVAQRITTLARLAEGKLQGPTLVIATLNATLQRLPHKAYFETAVLQLTAGTQIKMEKLLAHLIGFGFRRTGSVMERGEFSLRGGIIDLFPPAGPKPLRLDFFGDQLESIRPFDPTTQRSEGTLNKVRLLPVSEIPSGDQLIPHFRQNYVALFGAVTSEDPLYEAVSEGRNFQGMEHWLPLFHEKMETLFDYLPSALISLDHLIEEARARRLEQIEDHYQARLESLEQKAFGGAPYKPVPIERFFVDNRQWSAIMKDRKCRLLTPFDHSESHDGALALSLHGRRGRTFSIERSDEKLSLFAAVKSHVDDLISRKKRVLIASWSKGTRERLTHLLADHGLTQGQPVENWQDVLTLPPHCVGYGVLGLEAGLETPDLAIIGEQDIFGDRLIRRRARSPKGSDVLSEASSLDSGDLVVHADHGIGRFEGLKTITAAGAPHDCLELIYQGGDRLYLPVENIDLLSRYGSDQAAAQLDRLGGASWQARKSRLKKRIRDIAEKLIQVAAMRALKEAPVLRPPEGLYEEFCARFPFEETDDQKTSIEAVISDLASGRPMDRLVCGDVGFGKTEVALRCSLISVMSGKQVALIVPTTLLARQHFHTFSERFRGFPVRIAQASRLVSAKDMSTLKVDLKSGEIDIVIGTHALLGKNIEFADLGLIIIDEEQHFGVQHKERLKEFRGDVHVLTLTATPIPRTLQLALSGVRELSLITTPPIDRLVVRTFISPFDPLILREALMRERYRGGQSFYVCPRISDLDEAEAFLREHVPELKIHRAHGQMPSSELEDVMNAFYDQKYDVLLSTTIIESGLDIPTANTLIVHHADRFGLSQLYQLRGRVGRSKTRAYAYFTMPPNARLTPAAEKRLKVLHSLDTLGAGFTLASHDLDIRGAGNLLGEEQSGHIREVGFELYQLMLEEAVASLKGGDSSALEDQWSPQISIGTAVLLPDTYVEDLQVRLGLYRRLSSLSSSEHIDQFAAELADRFGPLPEEVLHLLDIVQIKVLCRVANISQIDAGPKGALVTFRKKDFANPQGLIAFVSEPRNRTKLRPDHTLIYRAGWEEAETRLKGVRALVSQLADIAKKASRKAA